MRRFRKLFILLTLSSSLNASAERVSEAAPETPAQETFCRHGSHKTFLETMGLYEPTSSGPLVNFIKECLLPPSLFIHDDFAFGKGPKEAIPPIYATYSICSNGTEEPYLVYLAYIPALIKNIKNMETFISFLRNIPETPLLFQLIPRYKKYSNRDPRGIKAAYWVSKLSCIYDSPEGPREVFGTPLRLIFCRHRIFQNNETGEITVPLEPLFQEGDTNFSLIF